MKDRFLDITQAVLIAAKAGNDSKNVERIAALWPETPDQATIALAKFYVDGDIETSDKASSLVFLWGYDAAADAEFERSVQRHTSRNERDLMDIVKEHAEGSL